MFTAQYFLHAVAPLVEKEIKLDQLAWKKKISLSNTLINSINMRIQHTRTQNKYNNLVNFSIILQRSGDNVALNILFVSTPHSRENSIHPNVKDIVCHSRFISFMRVKVCVAFQCLCMRRRSEGWWWWWWCGISESVCVMCVCTPLKRSSSNARCDLSTELKSETDWVNLAFTFIEFFDRIDTEKKTWAIQSENYLSTEFIQMHQNKVTADSLIREFNLLLCSLEKTRTTHWNIDRWQR